MGGDRFLARFTALAILAVIGVVGFVFFRARDARLRGEVDQTRAHLEQQLRAEQALLEKTLRERTLQEQALRAAEEEHRRHAEQAAAERARELEREGADAGPAGVQDSRSLGRDAIHKVVNKRFGAVQACFERELLADPTVTSRVTVEFVIAASGRVSSAKATTPAPKRLEDCILRVVKSWVFPASSRPTTVTYPFGVHFVGY